MRTREAAVDAIVEQMSGKFRTFGGGRDSTTNPMAHALKNEPLMFAAGVDVRAVVEFVLRQEDEQPSTCGAVMLTSEPWLKCPKCGAVCGVGYTRCPRCGHRALIRNPEETKQEP